MKGLVRTLSVASRFIPVVVYRQEFTYGPLTDLQDGDIVDFEH